MGIIVQNRQRRLKLSRRRLQRWADGLFRAAGFPEGEICARIVSEAKIRELNGRFRGEDCATDVMAFPAGDALGGGGPMPIGDIAISGDAVIAQAGALGHSEWEEIQILLAHGVAHLLGYEDDTESNRKRMRRAERRLRASANEDREAGQQLRLRR